MLYTKNPVTLTFSAFFLPTCACGVVGFKWCTRLVTISELHQRTVFAGPREVEDGGVPESVAIDLTEEIACTALQCTIFESMTA